MLDVIKEWLFSGHLPYLSVFGVLLAAGMGLPFPEDIPLLAGGYMCHKGWADVGIMFVVAMLGVIAGDSAMFWMGRMFGDHVTEHRMVRRVVTPARLLMAERLFAKHGIKILFIARFVPGFRAGIFVAAGVLRVPFYKYLSVNGAAALISVPLFLFLGYHFGGDVESLIVNVKNITHVLGILIVVVAIVAIAVYINRREERILEADAGPDETSADDTPSEDTADAATKSEAADSPNES